MTVELIASVSQVERYDDTQTAGCPRAWWFERVRWLKPEQSTAQSDGDAGHALLAAYLSTGALPGKRVKMGKMVTGAIVKGDLPKPGDDLVVEARFDGSPRPKFGEPWPALNIAETLHLGGVPWDGFIDLAFRRGDVPEIWDHKFFTPARPDFSSDRYAYLKKPSELIKTVQMPVYVMSQRPYWPDAKRWRLVHHCVSREGVDSVIRSAVVELDDVLEQAARIEGVIARMKETKKAEVQDEVPFNRRACSAFSGCPHQSICSAFKERNTVQLTAEEAALFDGLESPATTPPPVPDAEEDEETKLERQLAEAKARKAAASTVTPAAAAQQALTPAEIALFTNPTENSEIAELKRKLAEAEAKTSAPKPERKRAPMIDCDEFGNPIVPGAAPVPPPTANATPTPAAVTCACGTPITAENGSRLQSGEWKHVVGCKLNAPPAATTPAPEPKKRGRPPKATTETPAVTTPPVFAGERQTERDATAALDAVQAAPSTPAPATPAQIPDRGAVAREALAVTLENIAKLIRSVA